MDEEKLGPAERIVQSTLAFADHLYHGRPGVLVRDESSVTGVRWAPALWKLEDGQKIVFRRDKARGKTSLIRLGALQADGTIPNVGRYAPPGLFEEVAVWLYRQVAEVWKLDNELAARWASYTYNTDDNKDRKVVMAAFMLVQSRKGEPILDAGKVAFHDEDFRDVGEAMVLLDGARYLDAKLLLRIKELLTLPGIAAINRELGFGNSGRSAFLGRLPKVIEKWLRYREENPKILNGLIKKGYRTTLKRLAQSIGYKPVSSKFFEALRWKQVQAQQGHRTIAIGVAVQEAETWKGLSETAICERIVATKPNFKRIVGLLPEELGLTRAIMAAAIEAGSLSDKDLTIYTPTLEELGLLQVPEIRARWQRALAAAEDQRAANIAARVKSKEVRKKLQDAADTAVQKAVEEVIRGLRAYLFVDISGSMEDAIATAKRYIVQFLPGFPLDKFHVAVFNTAGREVAIKHNSAAGVENAFRGIKAGGGTDYGAGVSSLKKCKPKADEDALFIFVGDEGAGEFSKAVRDSGLNPLAFALVPVVSPRYGRGRAVRETANWLSIPCFEIDEKVFADPYAIPRTLRNLIAATPVGVSVERGMARASLVETVLATPLLAKPAWAA